MKEESNQADKTKWYKSKEAQKKLKIRACDLMHKREAGELKFKKVGNGYFYDLGDVEEEEI